MALEKRFRQEFNLLLGLVRTGIQRVGPVIVLGIETAAGWPGGNVTFEGSFDGGPVAVATDSFGTVLTIPTAAGVCKRTLSLDQALCLMNYTDIDIVNSVAAAADTEISLITMWL